MQARLLAFRVAKPVSVEVGGAYVTGYNPQTQTLVWSGGTVPLAAGCSGGSKSSCNAYGTYCTDSGRGSRGCD